MENKLIIKCNKCKHTGKVKFKSLDDLSHYQWVKWETRDCECSKSQEQIFLYEQSFLEAFQKYFPDYDR